MILVPHSPWFFPPVHPELVEGSVGKPREIGGTIRLVSKLLQVILASARVAEHFDMVLHPREYLL
jgi:hypothetical protein